MVSGAFLIETVCLYIWVVMIVWLVGVLCCF